MVFTELASAGASEFKTGTFQYMNDDEDDNLSDAQLEAKYKDKSFFVDARVYIDTNGNKKLKEETPIRANGGTVKVAKSGNTYTIEYNLTLENGKTLKGRNASTFTKVNG
jgi:hypothetical protein